MSRKRWVVLAMILASVIVYCIFRRGEQPKELSHFVGKNMEEILEVLGVPNVKSSLVVEDGLLEYQMGLFGLVPENKEVLELLWKDDRQTIAIWLVQHNEHWSAVHAISWSETIRM